MKSMAGAGMKVTTKVFSRCTIHATDTQNCYITPHQQNLDLRRFMLTSQILISSMPVLSNATASTRLLFLETFQESSSRCLTTYLLIQNRFPASVMCQGRCGRHQDKR